MSLLADIRFAIRMLGASRGFTAVAVLCLALGIGATSAIFTMVERTLFHSLPYKDPEQLVTLNSSFPGGGLDRYRLSVLELEDIRKRSNTLDSIASFAHINANTTFHEGDKPESRGALIIEWNALDTLGVELALGRDFRQEESVVGKELVIILTHDLWQRQYHGDPRALGKKVIIDTEPHEIVGILPPGMRFPIMPETDILAPLAHRDEMKKRRVWRTMNALARLKPGMSVSDLSDELAEIADQLEAEYPKDYLEETEFTLVATPLGEKLYGSIRPAMLALLAAVLLVLLIACANVASLLLARGMTREREFAVRAAIGASRRRLIMQLLTESLMLSLLGAAGGLLGALWGTDLLTSFYPDSLPRLGHVRVDAPVLAFTIGLSLLTGLVAGLVPALQSSHIDLQGALKDGGARATVGRRGRRVRIALVTAEIALALVLLVGAALMLRSLGEIRSADLGFRTERLTTIKLKLPWVGYLEKEPREKFVTGLMDRVAKLPAEPAMAVATAAPLGKEGSIWSMEIEGREGLPPVVETRHVSANYFDLMGIAFLEGETFQTGKPCPGYAPVIIDEAMLDLLPPGADPVGQRVRPYYSKDWLKVVGVVGHVKARGAASKQHPQVYLSIRPEPPMMMTLLVRTDQPASAIASAIEKEVHALDSDTALFDIETMGKRVNDSTALHRFATLLLGLFALLALLLASIGIYAVMAFSVAQRQHEIGIRLALGARPSQVVGLLVRQGLVLTALGVGVGVAVAALVASYLKALLYEVSPFDPLIYGICALVVACSATFACYLAARRATRVDPMDALRSE